MRAGGGGLARAGRAAAIVAALLIASLANARAEVEKRVALVIGNGDYAYAPKLDNPSADARAFAASLRRLGFQVTEGYDLTSAQMRLATAEFAASLRDAHAALVYYAGHGVSLDEENYLLPVDIQLKTPADLDLDGISVSLILRQMRREERVNIVILDACRDNPFAAELARAKTRAVVAERGLSRVEGESARGALIAFASDPKSVALDGAPGEHSPFTKALLRHIEDPDVSIDTVMSRVRSEVWQQTGSRQLPWVNTSIIGEFDLNPAASIKAAASPIVAATPSPAATPSTDNHAQEDFVWDSAQRSNLPGDYQAYLDAYPTGVFAAMARNRIASLTPPAPSRAGPAVNAAPAPEVGSEETERALGLDLAARKEIQQRLALMGLGGGVVDGDFGDQTRSAIRLWQERRHFTPSGRLGPLQLAALKSESEAPYRSFLAAPPKPPAPPPAAAKPAHPPVKTIARLPPRPARDAVAPAAEAPAAAAPATAAPDPHFAPEVFNGLRALSDSLNATLPKGAAK